MKHAEPKERPILFSAPMVRAVLAGRKTMTRRRCKVQPPAEATFAGVIICTRGSKDRRHGTWHWSSGDPKDCETWTLLDAPSFRCPYGVPGDLFWVKETLRFSALGPGDDGTVLYQADGRTRHVGPLSGDVPDASLPGYFRWVDRSKAAYSSISISSIHMPRWASRIVHPITNIRLERLQDITEEDSIAEGIWLYEGLYSLPGWDHGYATAKEAYRYLYESINGKGSWDANDWVWVIEFEVER